MRLKSSQGSARPMQMSKTLDPMDDDTALSPNPCFATITAGDGQGKPATGFGVCRVQGAGGGMRCEEEGGSS